MSGAPVTVKQTRFKVAACAFAMGTLIATYGWHSRSSRNHWQERSVKSARPVSGLPNLRDSAVNAVLQWQYKPTLVDGVAVEVDTTVSVVFPPLAKQEPPIEHK